MSSAPPFEPQPWNVLIGDSGPRALNNCYAYFLQDRERDQRDSFPQPGAFAAVRAQMSRRRHSYKMPRTDPYRCDELVRAIRDDNPAIFAVARAQPCPRNYYKGFLAVDNTAADSDYHFWIQNADGEWSHKPGSSSVTALDFAQQPIDDPLLSDRGRYNVPCAYFCVPSNGFADTFSTGSTSAAPRVVHNKTDLGAVGSISN